jgi:EmrB/QacA subfamily drug resistance transporter
VIPGTDYAARLSPRRLVLTTVAVMSGMFLAALDGTVVATAMPTVILDLHGLDHYAWVFSAYLLTEIVTIPLWGKLADTRGRKFAFLTGMTIFLVGSALAGLSQSMPQLIAFRALQGIGAGSLLTVAQTIVGDLFTLEQRVRMQAAFTAVFAVASIAGPLVGGFLTDHLSWRWVFYVNLPAGAVAGCLIGFAMLEPLVHRVRHTFDWAGMATLTGATGLLLYALESGGRDHPWASPVIVGCLAASAVLVVAFLACERRAPEPLLPLAIFANPVVRAAAITSVVVGMTMFAVVSFLPLFMQTVIGTSATGAGRILTPLMLGFVVASLFGGRLLLRTGYRQVMTLGTTAVVVGLALIARLGTESTSGEVARDLVVLGLGMGLVTMCVIVAAQNAVGRAQLGVVTSTVNFTRHLGGVVGVAIAGAIVLNGLAGRLARALPAGAPPVDELLRSSSGLGGLDPGTAGIVRQAFSASLHEAFLAALVLGVLAAATTLLMPRGRPDDLRHRPAREPAAPATAEAAA